MFLAQCFRFHSGEYTLVILEIRDAIFFTWQTIPLWGKPLLCSLYFSVLCHNCYEAILSASLNMLPFSNTCIFNFYTFSTKILCAKAQHHAKVELFFFPVPLYRLNTSWSWYSNTLGFSTLSFQQVCAFRQNIILRGTLHPFMQKPHSLSCSFFNS